MLNHIGSVPDVNHLFFPESGGNDLRGAAEATEHGLISLDCNGASYYVKPESLSFESFGDPEDYQWSYFRLALSPIPATGTYKDFDTQDTVSEELLELSPGEYVSRGWWDAGEHDGEPSPEEARVIVRFLRGSLVIFQKLSFYNQLPAAYLAVHNKVDSERFRQEVAAFRRSGRATGALAGLV